jgi:hypothetical protein
MPRGATRRRPTEDDLNAIQRAIHEALPPHLQASYLHSLPDLPVQTESNRKKGTLIRERVTMLDGVLERLHEHRRELDRVARELEKGTVSASQVDLRELLGPPTLPGVSMRYVRARGH